MANVFLVIPVLLAGTAWMYFLTLVAPALPSDKSGSLKFPGSLRELQDLADITRIYYERNWFYVIVLYSSAFLYKQTFAIPGTVFLNVLGGALFGVALGFPLCCGLTAVGASCCYLLSAFCGKELVQKYFPHQLQNFQGKVQRNSQHLVYYLLFLRMFPMSPNWLINVIAPLVGVPLPLFFITVLIGLAPYVLVCTQAGVILSTLTSLEQLFSIKTLLHMGLLAIGVLSPTLILRKAPIVT